MHQAYPFSYQLPIPERSVLLLEGDEVAVFVRARLPTGLVQEDQREQTDGFGLREKAHDETAQVQRVFAEVSSNERFAGRRGIPFVVH